MKQPSEMGEREFFAFMGRRPGLVVGKPSFDKVTVFLAGYATHADRHGGPDPLDGFHEWLVARRGRNCNHGWPGQVLHIALPHGWENIQDLPPEDEQRAIEVLFELLDAFLAEREATANTQAPA
ncbi:hypothetical protein ACIA8O_36240 [Kitasatospora sp. NPDC051853]|uniref:hypothetical protein n=1 Tax=Kitasatospora sp. NPDC051853 TaxID=3364058 RepID=UPI0037A6EAED